MTKLILFTTCGDENPSLHKCAKFSNDGTRQCSCPCHEDDQEQNADQGEAEDGLT
jgi:hypothetical protein